jgi:hypothetical protein
MSGHDIAPFPAPAKGIELQPSERYDVLLSTDQPVGAYKIHMER